MKPTLNYLLIGNGPSRLGASIPDFVEKNNIIWSIGSNGIWKDYPGVKQIVMWDPDPLIDTVKNKKMDYDLRDKLILPDKIDKSKVSYANSGIYSLEYLFKNIDFINNRYIGRWTEESKFEKVIHLIGFDCFLKDENASTSTVYGYYNIRDELEPAHKGSPGTATSRVQTIVKKFEEHLKENKNFSLMIHTNGWKSDYSFLSKKIKFNTNKINVKSEYVPKEIGNVELRA